MIGAIALFVYEAVSFTISLVKKIKNKKNKNSAVPDSARKE